MTDTSSKEISKLEYQIQDLKSQVAALRRKLPKEPVGKYIFKGPLGAQVALGDLFDARNQLILIHNMGRSCTFCTMWADGFVGLLPHLLSRAAFVVISNDAPDVQEAFAASRKWPFRMYSAQGTTFFEDMGFVDRDGWMPGVSVYERASNGEIYRVGSAEFGPGDDFCPVWHFFDLLPEGVDGWEPKLDYSDVPLHTVI